MDDSYLDDITKLANRNIYLCKKEWDFMKHLGILKFIHQLNLR